MKNLFVAAIMMSITSCNKLVDIKPPVNTIVTEQVFSTDANANAAVTGIYSRLAGPLSPFAFSNGGTALWTGISSDEFVSFYGSSDHLMIYQNSLVAFGGPGDLERLWTTAYECIYQINACLENLDNSPSISIAYKQRLTAEVKFLRAFCYFNLINLFGDVPFVTTTEWKKSALDARKSKTEIYDILINDLKIGREVLPETYSLYNNERVRATKWANDALLARLYLYTEKWADAEITASKIIDNNLFSLNGNLNDVFLKNSSETILQWHLNSLTSTSVQNVTPEGYIFIPRGNGIAEYYLSNQLLGAFELSDKRKNDWVGTITYSGNQYDYFFKYKKGPDQMVPGGPTTEYSMVFRLAELYLIRAEARAQQNKLVAAAADIDVIRLRAGLLPTNAITKEQLLDAIMQERRVELFGESGHRWFDLKRTGRIDAVMSVVTPLKANGNPWKSYQQLYPIPFRETQLNPNLTQNPGYN